MDHTYAKRKSVPEFSGKERASQEQRSAAPVTSLHGAPEAGSAKRLDLSDAIRTKMENAFGTDLSAVRLYESEAVAEHGAGAVAQGNTIAFAPGLHDFSSRSGQEILGHELSHVVSQRRGEVTGSGFLNNAALEARADREGALAAAGEQVYDGPVAGPLSGATADAAASGPMQAWDKKPKRQEFTRWDQAYKFFGVNNGGTYDKWERGLSGNQRKAIHGYSNMGYTGDFQTINGALRDIPDESYGSLREGLAAVPDLQNKGKTRKILGNRIDLIDSALAGFDLRKPLTVYRGSTAKLLGDETDPKRIMDRYGGRTVRDKGFTSTSAVKGSQFGNSEIQYIITVPPGKGRGAFIAPIAQIHTENEFLLKRNTSFVVKKAYREQNQTFVEMEVQDIGDQDSAPAQEKK